MKDVRHPQSLGEIDIGGVKYLHKPDEKFDYLMDISENKVKIHLKFTKDQEKRNEAKNAPNELALLWCLATAPSTTSKNPLSKIKNPPSKIWGLAKKYAEIIAINGDIIVIIFGFIFNLLAIGSKCFVSFGLNLSSIILIIWIY